SLTVCVDPTAATSPVLTMAYAGDNSSVVLAATVSGVSPNDQTRAGFNVYSPATGSNPAETATLASNEANNNPAQMQFAFAGSSPGPLRFRPFNYTANSACFSVTPIQLPTGVSAITVA
ncbi:MAG: hypothetical protein JOZ39_09930, partial [Chloroflexi bacterium]|nr:hypothetical protein [Chloroflexota bacterium]